MTVDGRKIVVITKDDQGKPDLAKSALTEAFEDDGADIAVGTTSSPRDHRHAAGRRGAQEDPDRRARGRRPDHRRQVEPLHLPHRAATPRRTRSPTRSRSARPGSTSRCSASTTPSATTAWPRSRRRSPRPARSSVDEEYAPANTTDFTGVGQRLFDALKDKPGKKLIWTVWAGADQPARQARRPRPRALRHRLRTGGQHPAGRSRPTSGSPASKARPTITTRSPRTRSTTGWSPSTRSASTRRRTSSPPAVSPRPRRW